MKRKESNPLLSPFNKGGSKRGFVVRGFNLAFGKRKEGKDEGGDEK